MRAGRALIVALCLASPPATALEPGALFRTPEQRAAARLAAGEHEALVREAPDARWEGVGRYAEGDAAGAAEAFARALDGEGASSLSPPERDALLYNRATAETRAGRPAVALPLYDALLERDPTHADALHNREIARQLLALDERDGSPDGGDGSEGQGEEAGREGERGDGSSGSGDPEAGEAGQEGAREGDEAGAEGEADAESGPMPGERDPADGGARDGGAGSGPDEGADDEEARARAAREALDAERRAAEEAAAEGTEREAADGATASDGATAGRTPSEREQATEQWLRRIADDPSGLLRRRLERSHREDYPEVRDGDEPW